MHERWETLSGALDKSIREGRIAESEKRLERLSKNSIPRPFLVTMASLARRAGHPETGLRWLNPVVRVERGLPSPSEDEIIEYAACLTRIGLSEEALALLSPIDPTGYPKALFERGAALVSQWEYGKSIPIFERYLKLRSITPYERLVGQTNLAAALVHEKKYVAAAALLRGLLHATSARHLPLLWSNVLQFSALNFISQKKIKEARKFLRDARRVITDERSLDLFLVRKWETICDLLENPQDEKAQSAVAALGAEGGKRGHWETLRDCDRKLAVLRGDEALLLKLYFGTPYESFRAALLREFSRKEISVPEHWDWQAAKGKHLLTLPISASKGGQNASARRSAGTINRALLALTSDLYRPFRITTLFSRIYPGEIYHPESSPNRTHQVLNNTRAWLKKNAPGVRLSEVEGGYRIELSANWGLRIPLHKESLAARPEQLVLSGLRHRFGEKPFSSREAAEHIGAATRTAVRLLKAAVESGDLSRTGVQSAARYRFTGE